MTCKQCNKPWPDYSLRDGLCIDCLHADAAWGKALWNWLLDYMGSDCGLTMEMDTEDMMRFAQKHGKAKRVIYDPAVLGVIDYVEPGDEIWWWGDQSL